MPTHCVHGHAGAGTKINYWAQGRRKIHIAQLIAS